MTLPTSQLLIGVTVVAAAATVLLLPVLVSLLWRGRIFRAARTSAAILLLTVIGVAAALPLAHSELTAMPPP